MKALICVLAMTTRLEVEVETKVEDSSLLSIGLAESSRMLGRLNCANDLERSLREGNVTPNSSSDLKMSKKYIF